MENKILEKLKEIEVQKGTILLLLMTDKVYFNLMVKLMEFETGNTN